MTGNRLDELVGLANTAPHDPAVAERIRRADETTRFQIDHDPAYARELAWLRSWVADYEIPQPEDIE